MESNLKKEKNQKGRGCAAPIVKDPNRILRNKSEDIPVKEILSSRIQKLINTMKDTLANTPDGVGLAAPQIGESYRIFIVSDESDEIDRSKIYEKRDSIKLDSNNNEKPYEERDWKYYVFINPKIIKTARKKISGTEGCLSVPGKFGEVARHEKITIEAFDENAKKITKGASKFFARVIQHELDHLDGIIFTDKAKKISSLPKNEK